MNNTTLLKQKIAAYIDELSPALSKLSRAIHEEPELAFEEIKASRLLCDFLSGYGFSCQLGIANLPTAFIAAYPPDKTSRPTIAFLAEYDALPKIGHACGHNLIAAAGIAAAIGLSKFFDESWGRILVIGTPAEEGGGGKIKLVDAGIFNDLDAALMFHPDSATQIVKQSLAMVSLTACFYGKPAHAAAAPYEGRNALDGVILGFNNISALRQQIRSSARIHGIITHGGDTPNIIPEFAAAKFMVRSLDAVYLEELVQRVENCLKAAALASGTHLELKRSLLTYAPFKPDYRLAQLYRNNLESLGVAEDTASELENIGSSDIGNVSQIIPTLHAAVAVCSADLSINTSEFAEAAGSQEAQMRMLCAAKALAFTGLDLFIRK